MDIRLNAADHESRGVDEGMVRDEVIGALGKHEHRITTVVVHVRDVNGAKGGKRDKQCTIEARLRGRDPVAVTADGPSLQQAVHAAANKIERRVDTDLGKLSARS